LAAAFEERGIGFVDAPVSGGSEGAINGTLAIMAGGSEADLLRATPLLQTFGQRITHVGPPGAGQVAKAVNQVVISGAYQAIAEGIVLAAKAGVDPRRVVAAIQNRAGNMIDDHYPLGFRLRLHRKDLGIALEAARASGASLPLTSLVAAHEDGLIAEGHGDEDMSTLARLVRRLADIPDGPLI
jgi:3-hydroxyisobutyrate dehydrogenase-like beta-hydroxyacid dehydrogenase